MDPSQEVTPPKVEYQKKVNIWTPITKLLPVNLVDLNITTSEYSMLGGLHAQMYAHNQTIAYPPRLHISKATDIQIVVDTVCLHLYIYDETKKEGF